MRGSLYRQWPTDLRSELVNLPSSPYLPIMPHHPCVYHEADESTVASAIDGALSAKAKWEAMPWNDRATIFLRAAELLSGKYCYKLVAATMFGQGKDAWQAEVDAAAEVCKLDGSRLMEFSQLSGFGVKYVEDLYAQQPPKNAAGSWNHVEYRALEGFVLAVSPSNFTAISGNLPGVPSIVGNTVVWKPSPAATYSNYLIYQILAEADVPPSVIQCIPGHFQKSSHPNFAALHLTGSTFIIKKLWKDIAANLDKYKGYPRIVGETEGKYFRVIHKSAEIRNAVLQTIRVSERQCNQLCLNTKFNLDVSGVARFFGGDEAVQAILTIH